MNAGNYYSQRREDFFFEYVRELLDQPLRQAHAVEQGGLKVYTTIDLHMQRLARKAIAEVLNQPGDPASAIVTLNPPNGDIEAMAESESYEKSQYNLAADGHRQPGSTFKAIVLADALSRGVDPNSTYLRLAHARAGLAAGRPELRSENVRRRAERGASTWSQATLASDNTVYAQLAADLGEESITAHGLQAGRQDAPLGNPARRSAGSRSA